MAPPPPPAKKINSSFNQKNLARNINVPDDQRNPYTIWFNYANQNLSVYNSIAFKYNMARLIAPLYISHLN
jgi:hypothetical protein